MIIHSLQTSLEEFESHLGWELNDRGACRGDVCIPLNAGTVFDGIVDVARIADQLRMPLVHDEKHGIWSLGPPSGGRALTSALAPPLGPSRNSRRNIRVGVLARTEGSADRMGVVVRMPQRPARVAGFEN